LHNLPSTPALFSGLYQAAKIKRIWLGFETVVRMVCSRANFLFVTCKITLTWQ
ncbi:hypothetical protein X975_01099, partial [Stegodyphus mimosarum]